MADFRYGPVELLLVGYEAERPDTASLAELANLVEGGQLRVLDIVIISKDESGELTIAEIEDEDNEYDFGAELLVAGLISEEDIAGVAELVQPGTSATFVALELAFLRSLAEKVATGGGVVLSDDRIPAPIVNALIDVAEEAVAEAVVDEAIAEAQAEDASTNLVKEGE
ncbi:hypothetical protein GCM10027568_12940 [Humibacter soli]